MPRLQLAALYGVPVSSIVLSLSSGSVVVEVQIIATAETDLAALEATMAAVNDTVLSSAIGSEVTRAAEILQVIQNVTIRRNETVESQLDCVRRRHSNQALVAMQPN